MKEGESLSKEYKLMRDYQISLLLRAAQVVEDEENEGENWSDQFRLVARKIAEEAGIQFPPTKLVEQVG